MKKGTRDRNEFDSFRSYLTRQRQEIDRALRRRLPRAGTAPSSLLRAIRYSLLSGGKRLRSILAREACRAVGGSDHLVLPACCALEMIHTYSLIHDDLPAMDDDQWRRGKPTLHVAFGEATAILAGDALQALAFQILADEPPGSALAGRRARVLSEVARAVGPEGMVGGQVRDLEAEGQAIDTRDLARIHRGKTGALFEASVVAGGILGGGGSREVQALRRFGSSLGLGFQIVDDILDEEGSRKDLGKCTHKDRTRRKATYPSLWGLPRSRKMAARAVASARTALRPFGPRSRALERLAEFVLSRDR